MPQLKDSQHHAAALNKRRSYQRLPALLFHRQRLLFCCGLLLLNVLATSADPARIRLNQIGFYPDGPKTAIVVDPATWYFSIKSTNLQTTYFTGELSAQSTWSASGEKVKCADFSAFTRPGSYVVFISGIGVSHPFTIAENTFRGLTGGLLRAFYYQRASTGLAAKNAGMWSRPAGHADTRVAVHPSAASDPLKAGARKAGEFYSSPKGWYDAGDYGKYVVNAGISTYELLLLYECFPAYFERTGLNIPESGNTLPDILDEIKWELDWLLTMQDGADGGVYHKLTSKTFCGDVMPAADRDARFFIGKGAAATFDFAAVLATAYRVYKKHLPVFADSCLDAAVRAWKWGSTYPDSAFANPSDVVTGEYGDRSLDDELQWAASELFIASGDSAYLRAGRSVAPGYGIPVWKNVGMLGCYSLALCIGDSLAITKVVGAAKTLFDRTQNTPYRTSISTEFEWGSNGVVANQGTCMVAAYLLTGNIDYLVGAIHACDYLLGRNATGYSFVTGYGSRSPANPHHRPSTADGIPAPVPGLLSGGPNAQAGGEGCPVEYPPMRARKWLDLACSYSSNEIAINWNAPAAFLAGAIDAIISDDTDARRALHNRFAADTTPPASITLQFSNIRSDRVTAHWKAAEPAAVTIAYNPASAPANFRRIIQPRADSASVTLPGLVGGTVYHVRCSAIDRSGNILTVVDSFRTENGTIDAAPFIHHSRSTYTTGKPHTISVFQSGATGPLDAKLRYSKGGSSLTSTTVFTREGDSLTATIPVESISTEGISYSITAYTGADTFTSPVWCATPESLSLTINSLLTATYQLVSFPGLFSQRAAQLAFSGSLGDTAAWRYFGYDAIKKTYTPFDLLSSGRGGWFYYKNQSVISWSARGIPPDTLFPLMLQAGWNCIGNPFPFPLFWDNVLVEYQGCLIPVSDAAAAGFVRRQFFSYDDTLPDDINNGCYFSNRKLDSHTYDSAALVQPWEGCWIYAERDSVTILLNPQPSLFPAAALPLRKQRETAPRSWFVNLRIRCGSHNTTAAVLGASEAALDGYDQFDAPKPPAIQPGADAGFLHPEWLRPSAQFVSDIIQIENRGTHRWLLDVSSAGERPVTITWQPTGVHDGSLSFVDAVSGKSGLLSEIGSYAFTPAQGETSRTIAFVWSQEPFALHNNEIPSSWSFSRVPGKTGAFAYTVPQSVTGRSNVTIAIYDIRGRMVCSLRSGAHTAGSYSVEWDRAAGHTAAAPGMYIARFSGTGFSKNIGMYFVK